MSINIKECRNYFNQMVEDIKSVSIQCAAVVQQYNSIAWGPYAAFDTKDEAEGIIGRYVPLLNELRQNIPGYTERFNQLVERFKAKEINSMDMNFELINISQDAMSYMEYLGSTGLPEIARALTIKQHSYQAPNYQGTTPPQTEVLQ